MEGIAATRATVLCGQALAQTNVAYVMLGAAALLTLVVLRRTWRRIGKQKREPSPAKANASSRRSTVAAKQSLRDTPKSILQWQVEMHETARDLKAELSTQAVMLQTLIRQARQESELLQQMIERAEKLGLPAKRDLLEAIEQGAAGADDLKERVSDPAAAVLPLASIEPQERDRVFQLADEGHSARAIAEQLSFPVGDVEMLLSLRDPCSGQRP